jgi:OHCU decarboxylase
MTSATTAERLAEFNALSEGGAIAALLGVCHSQRWAEAVAQRRPYPDLDKLQETADSVWLGLEPSDWREALEGHPRIGESGGSSGEFSRQEQAGMAGVGDEIRAAIAEGNRTYEERFGHVFLISAAGRSPQEILDNLRSRMSNDAETELRVAAEEHRRITRLRLAKLLAA